MEITEEQVEIRLESPDNLANKYASGSRSVTHKKFDRTRIPGFVRDILAAASADGQNQAALAREFDVSTATVNQLGSGRLQSNVAVDEIRERARDVALNKLMLSLGYITQDKLKSAKLRDLAAISEAMSRVAERAIPQNANQVTLVVYTPEVKQEHQFKSVDV